MKVYNGITKGEERTDWLRLVQTRELQNSWRPLRTLRPVRCHASALSAPDSISPAFHLTSPLCSLKAPQNAARRAELLNITSILSMSVFSLCSELFPANEFVLYHTCPLLYKMKTDPCLHKALIFHVLILLIEVYVQKKDSRLGRL